MPLATLISSTAAIVVLSIAGLYYTLLLFLHAVAIFYGTYLFTRTRKLCHSSSTSPVLLDENSNPYERSTEAANRPFVTILKPLHGADIRLEENLESFFKLDYPNYEIIFCIQEDNDASVPICKKLQAKYSPKIVSKLFIDDTNVGTNPKINNMYNAWEDACERKSELLWICDSGVYVDPDTLCEMVDRVLSHKNTAVCHGMPYCKSRPDRTFGELIEKTYFGTQHARCYLFFNVFGINCMNGKSTLIKRELFEKAIGSLSALGEYIAEDFFMGEKLVKGAGYTLLVSQHPIQENTEFPRDGNTLGSFTKRMIRWTRLRMTMIPVPSILELFVECMPSGLVISGALIAVLYPSDWLIGIYVFCGHCCLWFTLDTILQFTIDAQLFRYNNIFTIFAAWFVREWLTIYIVARSVANLTSVIWGENSFEVVGGGKSTNTLGSPGRKSDVRTNSVDSSMLDGGSHGAINESYDDDGADVPLLSDNDHSTPIR